MDKKFLLRMIVPTVALAVAVISLLRLIPATAEYFTWFSWGWAVTIIAGTLGLRYLLAGLLSRGNPIIRKKNIWCGAAFLIITLFCLSWVIAIPEDWIVPLIAIIITGALFLGVLFTGGRKWDAGDNQKAGYKTYRERKKEEENA